MRAIERRHIRAALTELEIAACHADEKNKLLGICIKQARWNLRMLLPEEEPITVSPRLAEVEESEIERSRR